MRFSSGQDDLCRVILTAPQELDRIQGRGQSGAKSPLLWDEGQVEALLQGSPIVAEVAERLHVRP